MREGRNNANRKGDESSTMIEGKDTNRRKNGKCKGTESMALERGKGDVRENIAKKEDSGKENDKRRVQAGGRNRKGEERIVTEAMNIVKRKILEGKGGVNESISSTDVKANGVTEMIANNNKKAGTARIDGCVNKKEFDEADDARKEYHVNRSVSKEVNGTENRNVQRMNESVGEETNVKPEKEKCVNRENGEEMLEEDSVLEEDIILERKGSGAISAVEASRSKTEVTGNYCIFESCTDVNISLNRFEKTKCELKKCGNFLEDKDNCKNFCKGLTNFTDFHVNSCEVPTICPGAHNESCKVSINCPCVHNDSRKVPTICPGVHNDSCKVPIICTGVHNDPCKTPRNCPSIHNDSRKVPIKCACVNKNSCKVLTICPDIHNDSCKVSTNCPGIHNDSCKVSTNKNCPGIHNSSSKVPTNYEDVEGLPIKKNCPESRLNPASES